MKDSGLESNRIDMQDNALFTLIKSYCRESGVRNLQKHIEKVIFYLLVYSYFNMCVKKNCLF